LRSEGFAEAKKRRLHRSKGFAKAKEQRKSEMLRSFASASPKRRLRQSEGAKEKRNASLFRIGFAKVKQRLRRSGAKASPKRSKGFAKAEQRLRQSRAKASPKQSKGFAEAKEQRKIEMLHSFALASPKRSEGIGSAEAKAKQQMQRRDCE
jgi:hypothetical protein